MRFIKLKSSLLPLLAAASVLVSSAGCSDNQSRISPGVGASSSGTQPTIAEASLPEVLGAADYANPGSPLKIEHYQEGHVPFVLIEGGVAGTRRATVRRGVDQFVQESGAQAGLNGTFFANASLKGTDNLLIGPSLCGNEALTTYSPYDKKENLAGRPFVLLSAEHTRIVPYDPELMDDDAEIHKLLPGLTDAFLGGVWLVHDGVAADQKKIAQFQVHDADDPRRRAFFAIMPDGRPVLGATTYVASSTHLAKALQEAGVEEAVLLDSGFSTSLVYGKQILVTGHTAKGIPSRPVPHSLVLFDTHPNTAIQGTKVAQRVD